MTQNTIDAKTGFALDTKFYLPLTQIFAPQKPVNLCGRLVHVDEELRESQKHGWWHSMIIIDKGNVPFMICAFGIDQIYVNRMLSYSGKCVKLCDVAISFVREPTGPNANQKFNIVINGPHSAYKKKQGEKPTEISEYREDPAIPKEMPEEAEIQLEPSMATQNTVQLEENIDDLRIFKCDYCGDSSTPRCCKSGQKHPKHCEKCLLLDMFDVVPYCPSDGQPHKKIKWVSKK